MPPGAHPPQAPWSARYHQTARLVTAGDWSGWDRIDPSTRPRLASANGIRYAGAARAANNPEFGARFTTGGKGNIGGNIESGQKRPGARARQGCGNETVAVRRQAVRVACTPGLAHSGYPRLPPPHDAPWPAGLARSRTVDARRYPG